MTSASPATLVAKNVVSGVGFPIRSSLCSLKASDWEVDLGNCDWGQCWIYHRPNGEGGGRGMGWQNHESKEKKEKKKNTEKEDKMIKNGSVIVKLYYMYPIIML